MHRLHTLNPSCPLTARELRPSQLSRGHVVGLCSVVSWLVVGRVAGLAPASRALRAVSHTLSRVALLLHHIVAPYPIVSRLYRDTPSGLASRARYSTHLRGGRPYRILPLGRVAALLGCVVALPGHVVALPDRVVAPFAVPRPISLALCHNTIHCIVTQMGSSPSSGLLSIFFFFFFSRKLYFFICST